MAIEELLNPIEETHHIFQATDEDIYDAVMDAKAARARERTAAGDSNEPDDADDSDEPIKPTRARKEALLAALIVGEYHLKEHIKKVSKRLQNHYNLKKALLSGFMRHSRSNSNSWMEGESRLLHIRLPGSLRPLRITTPISFHDLHPSHRASDTILPDYLTLPHALVYRDCIAHTFLPRHTLLDAHIPISSWMLASEALETSGCEVLITRVPAMSSPVDRAKVLAKKISETYPGRDVHLISHSMGGIDCRYLITHLTQRTFRVFSLTTISTPHHGSSFASHFLSLTSTRLPTAIALLQLLPNGDGDGKAFECFTQEAMKEFNDNTQNVGYSHSVIAAQEGENDGMVSVQSARWGTHLGTLRKVNGWTGGLAGNLTSLAGPKDMHTLLTWDSMRKRFMVASQISWQA
ncbi:hypothetical protein V8E55_005986 [Tylopilus felleus]